MTLFWGRENIFFYNDAFKDTIAFEKASLLGSTDSVRQIWPTSWETIQPLMNTVLEGHQTTLYEDKLLPVFRNGKLEDAYWTFSFNPVKNEEGTTEGVLGIWHEVTQKIQEKARAEATKEQLNLTLEGCDLGTWDLDPQTMVFKYNQKTKDIFGLSNAPELNLQTAINVIHPDDRKKVQDKIAYALQPESGGKYDVEYTVVHPGTGEHHIVRAQGKAYFNSDNVPYRMMGTIQDITIEKLFSNRNEKLQQLIELSPDYMSMASLDDEMTYMNPAARALVGIAPDADLATYQIRDFYSEAQYEIIVNEVRPALKKEGRWSGFVRIKHQQTGEEIPCFGNYLLIIDQNTGKIISRGLTIRDLRPDIQARKEVEASEKRFRNLVQEAPVATAIYLGREMRIQWANDAMIKLWGKDKEVVGKTIREALPELEGQPFLDQLAHVFNTGEIYQATEDKGELVVDGELQTFYFNFSYKPLRDENGAIYGILNMAIDVTEMVNNKRKLEESEKAFRTLIMQAPIGICLLRGEDFIVDIVNEEYLQLVDRKREEFEKQPIWKVVPEAKEQGFDIILENVRKTGIKYEGNEIPVALIRNGILETFYLNFVYEPLFDDEGFVHSILVIVIDITQQVKLRQRIENAEERARLAVASGNLGTYDVNIETGEVFANSRFNELFDIDEGGNRNDYVSHIHPDDLPRRDEAYVRAEATGMLQYECRIQRRDGSQSWVQIYGQYYYNEQKHPYKIIGIVQDITDIKNSGSELERRVKERTEELVHLNEELQQFIYLSSHDLKEPLRKIQIFSSMAKSQQGESAKLDTSLDKIIQSASRMATLLTDLINYSTLSGADRSYSLVDLNKNMQEAIDESELIIKEKNAHISISDLPVIEGINFQLTRLFSNLLQNALKFTREGQSPEIVISSTVATDEEKIQLNLAPSIVYHKITITDNGVGFNQAFAEKIFQVFQRLHDRSAYTGNGIGLALCKKIVENHKGRIMAFSDGVSGATFTIFLPQTFVI